ncbi:MAG: Ppx/GppA family phosphatase [Nitrospirae bacterium]|nr:Ppx/GppA family phosphatase [Nitrospirota bacterium]
MSILAGIDIGTNTVRLLIADVRDKYNFREIRSERRITRLGEGLIENGRLMPSAENRTIYVLKEFGEILKGYPVEAVTAVATSAVREAENGKEFVERIKVETDFDIEIISGEEEARRTFFGVVAGLNNKNGSLLIIDIGGGSTEFIVSKNAEVLDSISTGLGVVKLTERFVKSDPVSEAEIKELNQAINNELKNLNKRLNGINNATFVGTAGTITTLAAIDQNLTLYNPLSINNYILKKKSVDRIFDNLKSMTIEERLNIPALEKGREDLIIAGTAIVLSVMEEFGFREMTVCDYGLREGIILDLYSRISNSI